MRRARSRATCSRRPLCPGLTPSDFPVRRRVQSGRTDRPWNYSDRRHCGIPSIHHDDSGILAEGAAEEHRERALGPDVYGHLDGIRDGLLDGILARRWPCPGRMRGSGVPEGPGLSTPRSLCGRRRARGGVRRGRPATGRCPPRARRARQATSRSAGRTAASRPSAMGSCPTAGVGAG